MPVSIKGAGTQCLSEKRIATLPHPAYSPDLVPCDFLLFPKMKELLVTNIPAPKTYTTQKKFRISCAYFFV